MEIRVREIVSSLEIGFDGVRMIGIKGMGGGGKTTLATTVFDHISIWFEGVSFVENVREVSKSSLSGLKELQKQVLSDVLNDQSIDVKSVSDGRNKIKRMMGSRKVLVVLDDVDDIDQLEALAGKPNWFKPGSRIIITTRDEQVLIAHRVNFIHDVNLLSCEEANCLLSRYAFGRETPIQGYEELSGKVVHYASGLPLTIKVLGSHLCGRSELEWLDVLERLKTIPLKETLEKLELSYNGLESDHKEIFLDVACLLKGMKRKKAVRILESCGFHAEFGLRVLEQKSLMTISNTDCLLLHDHLEEMGRNIVRRLHPDEPNRHSRLWIEEEIEDILINESGTKAIRGIKLEYTELHPAIIMKGLKKMAKLRFLSVDDGGARWEFDEVGPYFPNSLQSLHWPRYPFRCLPKTFQANKLINLEMVWSNISQLWEGTERKVLNNLKFLYLNHSKLRTFDLGMAPNLQTLALKECLDFVELNMPDGCIGIPKAKVPRLDTSNLEGCYHFVDFHEVVVYPKLKFLKLGGCKLNSLDLRPTSNLYSLSIEDCYGCLELYMPIECRNLKSLKLKSLKVSNLNLGLTPNIEELCIKYCYELVEIQMPFECPKLKYLKLKSSKMSNLNLGLTRNIEVLSIIDCHDFVELHMPVECQKVRSIKLKSLKVSNLNLGLTPNLEVLSVEDCYDFVNLHMPVECPNLIFLKVISSKLNMLNLEKTPNLGTLSIAYCSHIMGLQMPIECQGLRCLELKSSKMSNLNLGLTPNLEELSIENCYDLDLLIPIDCPKLVSLKLISSKLSKLNLEKTPNLDTLSIEYCSNFVELHMPVECQTLTYFEIKSSEICSFNLGLTPNLEVLSIEDCYDFVELHIPVECPKIRSLKLKSLKVCSLNLGQTPNLETLSIEYCSHFVELQMPIECQKLRSLELKSSKVSNLDLGLTPNLVELSIESYEFVDLYMSVECPKLRSLKLISSKLISLDLEQIPNLETLSVEYCSHLLDLHMSAECQKLRSLKLKSSKVSYLNLGLTPNLEVLTIEDSYDFVELYMPIECPKLRSLHLKSSKVSNLNLGLTPNLEVFYS